MTSSYPMMQSQSVQHSFLALVLQMFFGATVHSVLALAPHPLMPTDVAHTLPAVQTEQSSQSSVFCKHFCRSVPNWHLQRPILNITPRGKL
jgi:hypothetical protein